jgi:hypothetical protein
MINMYKKIIMLKNNIKMVKTKKMKPMDDNIPSYKKTQLIIMPPKYDPNVKPHEIFEGMKKVKKKKKK